MCIYLKHWSSSHLCKARINIQERQQLVRCHTSVNTLINHSFKSYVQVPTSKTQTILIKKNRHIVCQINKDALQFSQYSITIKIKLAFNSIYPNTKYFPIDLFCINFDKLHQNHNFLKLNNSST